VAEPGAPRRNNEGVSVDRRSLLGAGGAALLALAAPGAMAVARGPDYYRLFLDLVRAWKRHDVDAVLARMADDIVWYAYVGAAPIAGKPEVRKLLESLAPKRKAENWRIFFHAVSGTRLFVEGVDDFTDDQGHRIAVPYAGVIEFRDRLITGWRDYFDIGTLNKMKAGEPVPEVIEPLVSRAGEP
jgi:limonene-1,2-epoxide hydrolase